MVLVPSAPKEGSASKAYDDAVAQAALKLQGTPRWELAASDALLHFPEAAKTFSCAFGLEISKEKTHIPICFCEEHWQTQGSQLTGQKTTISAAVLL